MTLPAAREQETTQQPGDIIVGAPAASKVSIPPSDPTQMVNHHLVPAAGTYQIDPAHTFVDFTAQHLVVGHVRGRFTQLAGQITIAEDLAQSATSVTITAASIDTHVAKRDNDLRSARYLDTDTLAVAL
jgi:polyisoprenoid-binding protein YceI